MYLFVQNNDFSALLFLGLQRLVTMLVICQAAVVLMFQVILTVVRVSLVERSGVLVVKFVPVPPRISVRMDLAVLVAARIPYSGRSVPAIKYAPNAVIPPRVK
jgi:hypothetical protein